MPATAETAGSSEKPKSRQRQGPACAECRKRKLRCDGQLPRCGTCSDLGMTCEQTTFSTPRGPKKGHMKALQSRLANLEARLLEPECRTGRSVASEERYSNVSMSSELPIVDKTQLLTPPTLDGQSLAFLPPEMDLDMGLNMMQPIDYLTRQLEFNIGDPDISEVVRADLNQLYFERVHPFIPILHRRRYFAWVDQPIKTDAQIGLQYAVWTLASTFSAQSEHLQIPLREAAARALARSEGESIDSCVVQTEHAQARVMLLIHDLLKSSFDLVWRDAATTFRLLDYMRLYDLDSPSQAKKRSNSIDIEQEIHTEELRRTFWVAYTIDCFINIRSNRPPTFHESAIALRLPMPEQDYQSCRISGQSFLSEAMKSSSNHGLCPFSKSIIIANILHRAIVHGQQSSTESVYSHVGNNIWERHYWLEESLQMKSPTLEIECIQNLAEPDGLLIFSRLASQCIVLYLYQTLETGTWIKPEDKTAILHVKERVATAARELASIVDSLTCLSLFKIHPFTPLLLGFCLEFFRDRPSYADFGLETANLERIIELLAGMGPVNRLASHAFNVASIPTPIVRSTAARV